MNKTISLSVAITVMVLAWSANMNVKAQSLNFSQVLLVESSTLTVPAGKVWKVESILGQRTISNNTTMHASHDILINGTVINFTQDISVARSTGSSYTYGASAEGVSTVPFWLPAGTTLAASSNVSYISVIEFSVVP